MFRIGAHVSISDGFAEAVEHEHELGGNCGQIFPGSPRSWSVSEVDENDASAFAEANELEDVRPWLVHGTYLINFATPKDDLGEKSVNAVQQELEFCAVLSIPYYTFHPGAHTGAGQDAGVLNVAERLSALDIPNGVTLLLENTSGKGTTVGKGMEELHRMIAESAYDYADIGVCLDTCHLYAAGYDFTTAAGMADLIEEVDTAVGIENVEYLHLNDSKHPLGSEKDEHEHIGDGEIGDEGFRRIINHEAFRELPMVLETPVDDRGYAWNIQKCRDLRRSQ